MLLSNYYIVYRDGRIYRKQRKSWNGKAMIINKAKFLKQTIGSNGYKTVHIIRNKKGKNEYVHRILAEKFIKNLENKKTINHKDGNKLNNKISNLEWATHSENNQHAFNTGLKKGHKYFGEANHQSKITNEKVIELRKLKGVKKLKELSKIFKISMGQISSIQSKISWKHIN